ncbi:hypothetical protein, partial [Streptococcus mitis]|uniref:hypothetical protein n=1 Tax=Streptococcus mitis TaxID=28037 RepID=UPI0021B7D16D
SSSHAEAVSHIAQPEAQLEYTIMYWRVLGRRRRKGKKKKRLTTDVSSGANLQKKKKRANYKAKAG